ncbi:PD-(D/E)XK nuclease family protein [Helicobacter macacae]|uniref:PD-(D/E)XK endonuclease-like domain-containing protein n=1 Tax=Helicobacter macacae MIT 99-5501 TaxID=1357400 RepID=V8C759_9HELI|nr:PD-(D/E)XK nuclease family protein [Helicobacter macacae]ETD23243.1 hypothetical protein HMPREF2086_01042 [Helicobacter macacae MIT 99-5501]
MNKSEQNPSKATNAKNSNATNTQKSDTLPKAPLQERTLYVFSTQRLIMDFYSKQPQGLMPKALSIGEFFKKSYTIPHKTRINHRIQTIILQGILREVIEQKPNITNLLVFEKSFLGYLEGSDFLLYLFNEIKQHNIKFSDIPNSDIYADFTEHLAIIEEIFTRFENALQKEHFFSVPQKDEIVIISEFIRSFDRIEIFIDGFLNPLESYILEQIALFTPLYIHLKLDRYNALHFPYIAKMLEPNNLESGFSYTIDVQKKPDFQSIPTQNLTCKIIQKSPLASLPSIEAFGFELRIGQCAFVLEKVRELLASGVDGEQIAIITPSSDIVEFFELLDEARNLNYAMGKEQFGVFDKLESLLYAGHQKTNPSENNTILDTQNSANISQQNTNLSTLESILDSSGIYADTSPNIANSIQEILLQYAQIASYINALEWQEVVEVFLEDLHSLRENDTSGGKVRVIEVLETRGLSFEYVFVLDCNDDFIPKVKDSDMFLNTFMRSKLGMPTLKDREQLQKHYYYSLFLHTRKAVYLSHTQNDETTRASLLDELNIKSQNGDELYALFPSQSLPAFVDEEIILPREDLLSRNLSQKEDFRIFGSLDGFRFSPTSLWTFCQCKRKFYFKYLLKIKPQDEENLSMEIGTNLHNALCLAFGKYKNTPLSSEMLEKIKQEFEARLGEGFDKKAQNTQEYKITMQERFAYKINALEMRGFWDSEASRIQDSQDILSQGEGKNALCVLDCERELESSLLHNGKRFLLKGRIDRLDMDAQGRIWILDYKYSRDKADKAYYNFQLAFYKLLVESSLLENGYLGFLGGECAGDLGQDFVGLEKFISRDFANQDRKDTQAMESMQKDSQEKDSKEFEVVKAGLYFLRENQKSFFIPNQNQAKKAKEMILDALQDSAGAQDSVDLQNNVNLQGSVAKSISEDKKEDINSKSVGKVDFSLTSKLQICRNCPYIWLCNRA